ADDASGRTAGNRRYGDVAFVEGRAVELPPPHPAEALLARGSRVEGEGGGEDRLGHPVAGDERVVGEPVGSERVAEQAQGGDRDGFGADVRLPKGGQVQARVGSPGLPIRGGAVGERWRGGVGGTPVADVA